MRKDFVINVLGDSKLISAAVYQANLQPKGKLNMISDENSVMIYSFNLTKYWKY